MLLFITHWIVKALFIAAPAGAVMVMSWRRLRRKPSHLHDNMITFTIGAMIGVILTVLYAESLRGRAGIGQYVMSVYLAISMLLVLRGLDRTLRWTLRATAK